MARRSAYPTLLDEIFSIRLSDLKKWGHLVPGSARSGTIRWTNRFTGLEAGRVGYTVDLRFEVPFVELSYGAGGTRRRVRVELVGVPSNLGNGGQVFYFVCPNTKRRCRVLFLHGNDFVHRDAVPDAMYSVQSLSRSWRADRKRVKVAEAWQSFWKKHARTQYGGIATKRFSKFLKQQGRCPPAEEGGLRKMRDAFKKKWGDLVPDLE